MLRLRCPSGRRVRVRALGLSPPDQPVNNLFFVEPLQGNRMRVGKLQIAGILHDAICFIRHTDFIRCGRRRDPRRPFDYMSKEIVFGLNNRARVHPDPQIDFAVSAMIHPAALNAGTGSEKLDMVPSPPSDAKNVNFGENDHGKDPG